MRRATLGAVELGLDDPRLEPGLLLAAAAARYQPLTDPWTTDIERAVIEHFGVAAVSRVLQVGERDDITVRLDATPDLSIAAVDADRGQITIRVAATLRAWRGPGGLWIARLREAWSQGDQRVTRARLESFWTFSAAGDGTELVNVEHGRSGRHHSVAGKNDRVRDDVVLAAATAAQNPAQLPLEVCQNLPEDPIVALQELSLLDERFAPGVVEASVRRITESWESEPLLGGRGRVARGAKVLAVDVRRVRALRTPPEVSLAVQVRAWFGTSQLELAHDEWRPATNRTMYWHLQLDVGTDVPWRLVEPDGDPFAP